MKKTIELTNNQIEKAVESKIEAVKQEAKSKKAQYVPFAYDAKAIKIDFDKADSLRNRITEYYVVAQFTATILDYVKNNKAVYKKDLEALVTADSLTDQNKKDMDILNANIRKVEACGRYFRKLQYSKLNSVCEMFAYNDERVYNSYLNRGMDKKAWEEALKEFFTSVNVEMSPTLYTHINDLVGVKSAKINKALNNEFITAYKGKEFYMLMMNILTDLAIQKGKISTKTIESMKGEALVEIHEFDSYTTVERPSDKATVKEWKETLTSVGIEFDSKAKKADLIDLFNKAVKDGLVVAY